MPDEIWNCNVNVCKNDGDFPAGPVIDLEGYLSNIAPKMVAWFAPADPLMGTCTTLDYVKANNIGPDGKYTEQITHQRILTSTPGGGGAVVPVIMAIVVSWVTALSRGRGSKGRIFLPMLVPPMTPAGSVQLSPVSITKVVESGRALLNVLSAASTAAYPFTLAAGGAHPLAAPVVASAVDGSVHAITGVRVGDIRDVQRRRKDGYKEVYTAAPWPL